MTTPTPDGTVQRATRHMLTAAGGAAALLAAGLLGLPAPAGAAETAAPAVSSSSAALTVALPGFELATGASATAASASGALAAKGAGVLRPSPSGVAVASGRAGGSKSTPTTCAGSTPSFPSPFSSLLSARAACASASVRSQSARSGTAHATGEAASLRLDLSSVLAEVVKPATPVATALKGVLGTLPPLPAGGEPLSKVLDQAGSSLPGTPVVEVAAGPASSTSKVEAAGWTTTARASGATVTILPNGGTGGTPLAQILVGGASATATSARSAGHGARPKATDVPSLVTIEVNAPGAGPKTYSLVPGQSMTILKGTPLQTTVSVAAGSVTTSPSGAVTASAHGVAIDLAEGVGASPATAENGGVHLELADATATSTPPPAVPGSPAPLDTPPVKTVSNPVPNATVPHTGLFWAGGAPLLGGAALLGAGLLGWPRLKRRFLPGLSARR